MTALELAKSQAQVAHGLPPGGNSEDEDDLLAAGMGGGDGSGDGAGGVGGGGFSKEITKQELDTVVKTLSVRLEDLVTCSSLIGKHSIVFIHSFEVHLNCDAI